MSGKYKFKTFEQQLDILVRNQYIVFETNETTYALDIIKKIGYNTIVKYIDCLRIPLSFKDLYQLYIFDSHLKSEILRLIGLIEKSIKTVICNSFISNHEFDSLCYMNKGYFDKPKAYEGFYKSRFKKLNKNKETPLWDIFDDISFGDMVEFYILLREPDKLSISNIFNLNTKNMKKHLLTIKKARNLCAHFKNYIKPVIFIKEENIDNNTKLFSMLYKLTNDIQEWDEFISSIKRSILNITNRDVITWIKHFLQFCFK